MIVRLRWLDFGHGKTSPDNGYEGVGQISTRSVAERTGQVPVFEVLAPSVEYAFD